MKETSLESGAERKSITIQGTFRRLSVYGELSRNGGRFWNLQMSGGPGGKGTVTSTLHYTDNTCSFDKTYRTVGNVSPFSAEVVLGWQPTKRDLANLNLPGAWEFEALASARSGQALNRRRAAFVPATREAWSAT
jgi:hypothetical protein